MKQVKRMTCVALIFLLIVPSVVWAADTVNKDETVFVTASESGVIESEIVSVWIHTDSIDKRIVDKSILTDVKNIKGDQQPVVKDGELIWGNVKGDIYYQGNTDKALPIEVKITYYLDEKAISPQKLIGQSGNLIIKLELINGDKHMVELNGKSESVYTPFTTISFVSLSKEKFTNVKAEGAQLLSYGDNQIITFIAFPGLKESLKIDELAEDFDLDLNLKEMLEITAHVEEFEMQSIYITATPDLFEAEDIEKATTLDELKDDIDELGDASQKLTKGSKDLHYAQTKFYENMGGLLGGVNTLQSEMPKFQDGIYQIADGAEHAKAGADDLNDGAKKLIPVIKCLNDIKAFSDKVKLNAADVIPIAQTWLQSVKEGINELVTVLKTATGASTTQINHIQQNLKELKTAIAGLSEEDQLILNPFMNNIEASVGQIETQLDEIETSVSKIETYNNEIQGSLQEDGLITRLITLVTEAEELLNELSGLGDLSELSKGLNELVVGIDELDTGLAKLTKEGTRQLKSKTPDLVNGVNEIQAATVQLHGGSKQICDGSKMLSGNMSKFNREGMTVLSNEATQKLENLQEILDRKDKVIELAENYGTFSGLSDEMDGSVKFVIKTNELKQVVATSSKQVKNGQVEQSSDKGGFINWIKRLFQKIFKKMNKEQ